MGGKLTLACGLALGVPAPLTACPESAQKPEDRCSYLQQAHLSLVRTLNQPIDAEPEKQTCKAQEYNTPVHEASIVCAMMLGASNVCNGWKAAISFSARAGVSSHR